MPSNLPNNYILHDKSLVLSNCRFDKGVNIRIEYHVRFFPWLWRLLLRLKPLHMTVVAGNAGQIFLNKEEVRKTDKQRSKKK